MTLVAGRTDQVWAAARHPLRAEAVRGFAPWAGAAVLLTLAGTMAGTSEQWQGDWAETRDRLSAATGLLGVPLALATGCWHGGRERRRRTEELMATAVRGRLVRLLASALPLVLWVVAGYAATAVLVLLATWYCATGDGPFLGSLLADAVVLAAAALAGQVVGRVVAWRMTAALLAAGAYVAVGVLSYDSRAAVGALSSVGRGSPDAVAVWWQPVAITGWTGGVAVAAVLGYAARRRWTGLVPLAAAGAAGALLIQTGDGLWHTNPIARRQVCTTSTTPQICVNARYGKLLPQVEHALSGLTGRLEGVQNLPVRFEDRPGRPARDEVQLPMLTPIGWSVVRGRLTDPKAYAWEAGMALYDRDEFCDGRDPRLDPVDNAVEHYLAPSPMEKFFDQQFAARNEEERAKQEARLAARARLEAMGEEERRAWLSAYFATADECYPSEVPTL